MSRESLAGQRSGVSMPWITRIVFASSMLLAQSGVSLTDELAVARVISTPEMSEPAYLQATRDPALGTNFVRITDPGKPLLPGVWCKETYCTHRYSSAQAWNADQTLLVIANGCPGLCFLDGQTYEPLFQRQVTHECEWHPSDPEKMICIIGNTIAAWAVRSDTKTTLFTAGNYTGLRFGPGKGNLSQDGARLVVRAQNPVGTLVAFAYDIPAHTKYPDIDLSRLAGENSYCTISPSGRYIFCFQRMFDRSNTAHVFTIEGAPIQHWPENHRPGHGDMALDQDGADVYVGISKAAPDKHHVIKRRLADGAVTNLMTRSEAQHASVRNIKRPGWVFLTFGGDFTKAAARRSWAPFYQEVIALRIDGSGEMKIGRAHV
jgi:hypothetical protein